MEDLEQSFSEYLEKVELATTARKFVLKEEWDLHYDLTSNIFTVLLFLSLIAMVLMVYFMGSSRSLEGLEGLEEYEVFKNFESSKFDFSGVIVISLTVVIILFLSFYQTIRCYLAPKRYVITFDGDWVSVKLNEEEILHITCQQLTDFRFGQNKKGEYVLLLIDYIDNNSNAHSFSISLDFIPRNDCINLFQYVNQRF